MKLIEASKLLLVCPVAGNGVGVAAGGGARYGVSRYGVAADGEARHGALKLSPWLGVISGLGEGGGFGG